MYIISITTPIVITKTNSIMTIKDEILLHKGAKYYCKQNTKKNKPKKCQQIIENRNSK